MSIRGSYANGFAPRDGQPRFPELWEACVGAWASCLGVTGNTLRDWSGYGRNGTLTNGATWVPSAGAMACSFDGVNDHIPITTGSLRGIAFSGASQAAVCAWAFLIGATSTRQVIIADWDSSFANETFRLELSGFNMTANRWGGSVYRTGGFLPNSSSTNAVQNTWTHLCLQRVSDNSVELYVNGRLDNVTTASLIATPSAGSTITIGRGGAFNGAYFNGYIDDVRLYDRALHPSEIQLLASRRGIAYDLAPRRRTRMFAGFKAYWAARKAQILGGGL